jgi:hypothetical protein
MIFSVFWRPYKKTGSGKKLPDRNIKPERRREKSESDMSKLFFKTIPPRENW